MYNLYADQFVGRLVIDAISNNSIMGVKKSQEDNDKAQAIMYDELKSSPYADNLNKILKSANYSAAIKNSEITNSEISTLKKLTSSYYNKTSARKNQTSVDYDDYINPGLRKYYLSQDSSIRNACFAFTGDDSQYCKITFADNSWTKFDKVSEIEKSKFISMNQEKQAYHPAFNYMCLLDVVNAYLIKNNIDINLAKPQSKGNNSQLIDQSASSTSQEEYNKCFFFTNVKKMSFFDNDSIVQYRFMDTTDIVAGLQDSINQSDKYCTSRECKLLYSLFYLEPRYITGVINNLTTNSSNTDARKPQINKPLVDAVNNNLKSASTTSYNLAFYIYGQAIAFACNKNILNKYGKISSNTFDNCLATAKLYNDSFNNNQGLLPYQQERYAKGLNNGIALINKYKPSVDQTDYVLDNITNVHKSLTNRGLISGDDYVEIDTASAMMLGF